MFTPGMENDALEESGRKRSRRSTKFRYGVLILYYFVFLSHCADFSGDFSYNFGDGSSDEGFEQDEKKKRGPYNKQKRTKECPGCGSVVPLSLRECRLCDYQFTSKSMIMGGTTVQQESQSIRDKFPFEPERVRLFFFSILFFV